MLYCLVDTYYLRKSNAILKQTVDIYNKSFQDQINLAIKFSSETAELCTKHSLEIHNNFLVSLEQHSKVMTDYVDSSIEMIAENKPKTTSTVNKNNLN